MSVQSIMHRRKFIERSLLGAGSVLFTSALLESCTLKDHDIPGPDGPDHPPLIGDYQLGASDQIKQDVIVGLSLIPEVGGILSSFVSVFWPDGRDDDTEWSNLRDQVNAIVDAKIDQVVYSGVSNTLQGLHDSMVLYLNEVKENGTPAGILGQWEVTRNSFVTARKAFQQDGYEVGLLPFFAQYVNMHLSLLRDAVLFGESWGRNPGERQQDIADLKQAISDFTTYTNNIYTNARFPYTMPIPFNISNGFERQMTLSVLDFRDTWQYYDAVLYPNGTDVVLTREIYSDLVGKAGNQFGVISIPSPPPTRFPNSVKVWGSSEGRGWISGIQVTYPEGGGPGGITQKTMGLTNGSTEYPNGGVFDELQDIYSNFYLSEDQPLLQAFAFSDPFVNEDYITFLQIRNYFHYRLSMGGQYGNVPAIPEQFYPNHALSSIYMDGGEGCSNCNNFIVVGYRYFQQPDAILNAIRGIYVKSVREYTYADLTKSFPKLTIPAGFITQELKAARQAHWNMISTRAH